MQNFLFPAIRRCSLPAIHHFKDNSAFHNLRRTSSSNLRITLPSIKYTTVDNDRTAAVVSIWKHISLYILARTSSVVGVIITAAAAASDVGVVVHFAWLSVLSIYR